VPLTLARLPAKRPLPVFQTSDRQVGPEVAREMTLKEARALKAGGENDKTREERESPSLYHHPPPAGQSGTARS
jgi:hypothetical protein